MGLTKARKLFELINKKIMYNFNRENSTFTTKASAELNLPAKKKIIIIIDHVRHPGQWHVSNTINEKHDLD